MSSLLALRTPSIDRYLEDDTIANEIPFECCTEHHNNFIHIQIEPTMQSIGTKTKIRSPMNFHNTVLPAMESCSGMKVNNNKKKKSSAIALEPR